MLVNAFCSLFIVLIMLAWFFSEQFCSRKTHKLQRSSMSGKQMNISLQTSLKFVLSTWTCCFQPSGKVSLPLRGTELLLKHELLAHFHNLPEHHSTLMSLFNSLPNRSWNCILSKAISALKNMNKQTKLCFPSFFLFILLSLLSIVTIK